MQKPCKLTIMVYCFLTPCPLTAVDMNELLSDISQTIKNVTTLSLSYKNKRELFSKLRKEFNKEYLANQAANFENFVIHQTTTYMEFIEETTKPLAALLQIFYTLCKNLAPLDSHFKLSQEMTELAYNSTRALYEAAQIVQGNLKELAKKIANPQYSVRPLTAHDALHVPIPF